MGDKGLGGRLEGAQGVEAVSAPWEDEAGIRGAEVHLPGIRVVVHRHNDHPKDVWLVSTHPDLFARRVLKSKALPGAKAEALAAVKARLDELSRAVGRWVP